MGKAGHLSNTYDLSFSLFHTKTKRFNGELTFNLKHLRDKKIAFEKKGKIVTSQKHLQQSCQKTLISFDWEQQRHHHQHETSFNHIPMNSSRGDDIKKAHTTTQEVVHLIFPSCSSYKSTNSCVPFLCFLTHFLIHIMASEKKWKNLKCEEGKV